VTGFYILFGILFTIMGAALAIAAVRVGNR
jgi:hypothetical protein